MKVPADQGRLGSQIPPLDEPRRFDRYRLLLARYLDPAAGKSFLTENAKPLIIQRLPASEMVSGTQDPESLVILKMNAHC